MHHSLVPSLKPFRPRRTACRNAEGWLIPYCLPSAPARAGEAAAGGGHGAFQLRVFENCRFPGSSPPSLSLMALMFFCFYGLLAHTLLPWRKVVLVNSSSPKTSIHFSLSVGLSGQFLHGLICFGTPDENDWIIDDDPTGDIVSSRTRLLLSYIFRAIVLFVFWSPLRGEGWMSWMGLSLGIRSSWKPSVKIKRLGRQFLW